MSRVDAREVARWVYVAANRVFGDGGFAAEKVGSPGARGPAHCAPAESTTRLPALPATIHPDARTLDPYAVAAAFKEAEMTDGCPLFVELCAGTAAVSLRLHAKHARPPVSRMGAKTGYADVILRVLGLRPGQGHADGTRYVWCEPDAGVRLLLEAYRDRELAQAAAEIIRGWKDEDPRALWERLRAEGPARHVCEAREVARWSWVQGHGSPDGRLAAQYLNPEGNADGSWRAPPRDWLSRRLDSAPALPATIHPDAREVEPREVARWITTHARTDNIGKFAPAKDDRPRGGWRGHGPHGEPMAARVDSVQAIPATIHPDAREVEPPVPLPAGTVAYMDGPYERTTGYAHLFPRAEQVEVARRWHEAGATVCISEAEPIPELVAEGWHAVEITGERRGQRRTFSKQQREWLTLNREPSWTPSEQVGLFG